MQMSCSRGRGVLAAAISSRRHTKMTETVKVSQRFRTQGEVTTCRIQQDISEWLVDEFMLLMWSYLSSITIFCQVIYKSLI